MRFGVLSEGGTEYTLQDFPSKMLKTEETPLGGSLNDGKKISIP